MIQALQTYGHTMHSLRSLSPSSKDKESRGRGEPPVAQGSTARQAPTPIKGISAEEAAEAGRKAIADAATRNAQSKVQDPVVVTRRGKKYIQQNTGSGIKERPAGSGSSGTYYTGHDGVSRKS